MALVLAGGIGERLRPLTDVRAKPAVPFGAMYRIIDFTLSNCVNSQVSRIFVLTQYKSHSLSKHLKTGWNFYSRRLNQFIDEVPAQMQRGSQWYKGTADAIRQNMNLVDEAKPAKVLVLSGDHIYKMDYRQLRRSHDERGANLTIAAIRVPVEVARDNYGVLEADATGRVVDFQEKPSRPMAIAGTNDCLASMGVYIFSTSALRKAIDNDFDDFGKQIIPEMIARGDSVFAYDFSSSNAIEEYEYFAEEGHRIKRLVPRATDSGYWRDVGSIDSFWAANLDLVSANPRFNLYGELWPIFNTPVLFPPAKFVHESRGRTGIALNSIGSNGVIVSGATVRRSILGPGLYIHSFAEIENSVLMGGSVIGGVQIETTVGRGCHIRNAIIDKCCNLSAELSLGFDRASDEARGFKCVPVPGSDEHIVVVPRDYGLNVEVPGH